MKKIVIYWTDLEPFKKHHDDVGWDLRSTEDVTLMPRGTAVIGTGVYLEIPEGIMGRILPRSGLSAMGIDVYGGVIDPGYRGEVKVVLHNSNSEPFVVHRGDRIAQITFIQLAVDVEVKHLEPQDVPLIQTTERGDKGFGSTGRR